MISLALISLSKGGCAFHAPGALAALTKPVLTRAAQRICVFMTLAARASAPAAEPPGERELVADNHFQRGFILLAPTPGKQVPMGILRGRDESGPPNWKLAQWSSRFPLQVAQPVILEDGALLYRNEARSVTLGAPGTSRADVALRVNTLPEYGNHARQKGEPWVHLLLEQPLDEPPCLTEIRSLILHLEARLLESRTFPMEGYSPHLHAAQFQVFLTVQNRNRKSPGYGNYLWFGIPVYDNRHRIPVSHKTKDMGGTDKFIFTPSGDTFTNVSAHDRTWFIIDKDLLPLLREALELAWSRGFLAESRNPADYRVSSVNLGWEVPGTFSVEIQLRHLSLRALPDSSS